MSEWYDNQKKSSSNFHKLLHERIESANPRRQLTAEEAMRFSLRVWFDRDNSFEVGGDLSPDIVSLPRIVTSRSHEKLRDDSRLTSKQSVKLAVVERAMYNIGRGTAPASKPTTSKLDKFLNTDD